MKSLLRTLFAALLLCVGCKQSDVQDDSTGVVLKCDYVEVSEEGGRYEVGYSIKNPINGVEPKVRSDAEWIVDIDTSKGGVVSFRVLVNDEAEAREASVELLYPSQEITPTFVVRQAAMSEIKIDIAISDMQYSECTAQITPVRDDMPFIVMMAEKSYFSGLGIYNVTTLIDADINYFNSLSGEGQSLEEFLTKSNFATMGKQTKRWQDLSPAKEYVIYAYGIDVEEDNYNRITPVYHEIIPIRLPERVEQSFDVKIEAVGPEVTFEVAPKDWDGYYMVQLVEDSEAAYVEQGMIFSQEAECAVAEAFFYVADYLYYFEEKSAEEIMQSLGYRGELTFAKTLNANHRYMALIYAIASEDGGVPMMVSHPTIAYFSTGTVERSDMTFEVTFNNVRPRSVDVVIEPSKSDETYTAVMMYKSSLPDGDKQEQLQYIMEKYAPLELVGTYEEHINQLPPSTEFIIAVYGFYAGAATTDLFVYSFTTAVDGKGDNAITSVKCSAYDIMEVVALESYYESCVGYADYFMSMEIETLKPSPALHFDLMPVSLVEEYGLEAVRQSLLEYSYTSSPDWALCTYGNEYVVCGLAEDERGYVGELYISEPISFVRGDVGDAAEFVELYKEYVTPYSAVKSVIFRR